MDPELLQVLSSLIIYLKEKIDYDKEKTIYPGS